MLIWGMQSSFQGTLPPQFEAIHARSEALGFNMPSDLHIGSLLRTLVSSKAGGQFLELGTGAGLSMSWMVEGMDADSKLITIDNDPTLSEVASSFFGEDKRVEVLCQDGTEWILSNRARRFDLIFADAWPGKYSELDETLAMLKPGGLYVIDDMLPQPNWPDGHAEKAAALRALLQQRTDFQFTNMDWSTGIILMTKKG